MKIPLMTGNVLMPFRTMFCIAMYRILRYLYMRSQRF